MVLLRRRHRPTLVLGDYEPIGPRCPGCARSLLVLDSRHLSAVCLHVHELPHDENRCGYSHARAETRVSHKRKASQPEMLTMWPQYAPRGGRGDPPVDERQFTDEQRKARSAKYLAPYLKPCTWRRPRDEPTCDYCNEALDVDEGDDFVNLICARCRESAKGPPDWGGTNVGP